MFSRTVKQHTRLVGIGVGLLGSLLISVRPAQAVYNANMAGTVAWVATYMDGDSIYFRLNEQPTSHPQCNPTYFVIAGNDVPANRRTQALAQLIAARYSGMSINIGFDNSGDCAEGFIRVHRVG